MFYGLPDCVLLKCVSHSKQIEKNYPVYKTNQALNGSGMGHDRTNVCVWG